MTAALSAKLRECNESRTPVNIEGGATLRGMGAARTAATGISTATLDAFITHEVHDLTCSVQAGMTLQAFSQTLAQAGQFVPLDAPLRGKATVGGTLSAGWLGPRRHYYGRLRDFAIGSQVILADGTIANAGGMVVKNVSGYDMTKLYIGSFGTLALVTQFNFKTLPLPRARRVLIAALPESTRERATTQVTQLAAAPAAALCVEGFRKSIEGEDGVDGRLFLLLEGTQRSIDRSTREIRSALGRAGVPETAITDTGADRLFERLLDAALLSTAGRTLTYRSLGTPESAPARARALRDAANAEALYTDVLLDIMNGDVFVRVSERESRAFAQKIEVCHDAIRAVDPRSVIVAGEAPIRESLDPWGAPPRAIAQMRDLKARFDPNGILNPGRFTGGI
ncbi:MAG: FAD-binding oxidoreductase [Candidatus Baltobacteraceae bacterium]